MSALGMFIKMNNVAQSW